MWSPNELLKIEKQRDILSYITLQFFHFKKVPLEHCPFETFPFFNFLYFFISFQQGRLFLCVFVLFLQLIPERKGETQLLL